MLDTSPKNLFEEIRENEKFMLAHEDGPRRLMRRYAGRFYRGRSGIDIPISENHAYQVLSRMVGRISFDDPRAIVSSADPLQQGGPMDGIGSTMGDTALGIGAYANRWSADNEFGEPLSDIAYDFFFYMGVMLLTVGDRPGENAFENLTPQQPYALRLDPMLWGVDRFAKNLSVYSVDGPRFKYHMWKADHEDLLKDSRFNHAAVKEITEDTDIEKYYDHERLRNTAMNPERKELLAYDIWVPEDQRTSNPEFNGSWHTIAVGVSPKGIGKRAKSIIDPRPAYCPPWGPYVEFGAYKVPNSPIPLSPLVATAEAAEEVNAYAVKSARDAASFKRFVTGDASNPKDATTAKRIKHGQMSLFENPESVNEKTIGGVDPKIYEYMAVARDRLRRESGLGEAAQNAPQPGVTATAESISDASSNAIVRFLQKRFTKAVDRVFRGVTYYAFYNPDVRARVSLEDGRSGLFIGGIQPGQEEFNFFDLMVRTEPFSLDGLGQDTLSRKYLEVFQIISQAAVVMAEAPYVEWEKIIDPLMSTMNLGTSAKIINEELLEQVSQVRLEANTQRGATPKAPGSFQNRTSGVPSSGETQAELAGGVLV